MTRSATKNCTQNLGPITNSHKKTIKNYKLYI